MRLRVALNKQKYQQLIKKELENSTGNSGGQSDLISQQLLYSSGEDFNPPETFAEMSKRKAKDYWKNTSVVDKGLDLVAVVAITTPLSPFLAIPAVVKKLTKEQPPQS